MKEITLDDLRVLVESLEDKETPTIQPDHKDLVDDGVREIQENVKDLYKEIKENQKKIDEQKALEEKTLLEESVKKLPNLKEQKSDPLLSDKIDSLAELQANQKLLISRLQSQLGSLGGGGEVRLECLDDVDRDSAKVDGMYLQYQASTGKFIGADASGGGGGGGSGITTADVRDEIQGYYGYTTDYYTVGVANTIQFIGAGETTMIMPQVAAVYQYMPTIMSDVNTNPYVGSGATIGTGQTEFSLAGLSSGASCIVRTALAFDPDEDNTNLDIQLKFTTNTATQGTGLTNFVILKENALIMQVGGDQQYISENLFSFFVGTTLEGTTYDNAGSFSIEVIPSNDGELEVLAVTVNVVA